MIDLNKEKVLQEISLVSAILLFPGFFFYHTLIGIGILPPILGGFFTPVAIMILVINLLAYLLLNVKLNKGFLIACLFFIFWLLFIFIQYVFRDRLDNLELLNWGLIAIICNVVCFITMVNLDLDSIKTKKIFNLCFFLICGIVLFFSTNGIFYLRLENDVNELASYQGFARSLLFVLFVTVVCASRTLFKVMVIVVGVLVLFINSARSELIYFIISIFLLSLLNFKKDIRLIFFIFFIFFIILLNNHMLATGLSDSRALDLLDLSNSTSYQSRQELTTLAWNEINSSPFFGNYGYYVDNYGVGSYSHNILSAWAAFGILGIPLFMGTTLYFFIFSGYQIAVKNSNEKRIFLLFLLSASLFIGYLTTKDYSYMLFGLCVGTYINYLNFCREKL